MHKSSTLPLNLLKTDFQPKVLYFLEDKFTTRRKFSHRLKCRWGNCLAATTRLGKWFLRFKSDWQWQVHIHFDKPHESTRLSTVISIFLFFTFSVWYCCIWLRHGRGSSFRNPNQPNPWVNPTHGHVWFDCTFTVLNVLPLWQIKIHKKSENIQEWATSSEHNRKIIGQYQSMQVTVGRPMLLACSGLQQSN